MRCAPTLLPHQFYATVTPSPVDSQSIVDQWQSISPGVTAVSIWLGYLNSWVGEPSGIGDFNFISLAVWQWLLSSARQLVSQ
jgi:hypothetical protein